MMLNLVQSSTNGFKTHACLLAVALGAFCTLAAIGDPSGEIALKSPDQVAAARKRMMLATGGFVKAPSRGRLVVVNAQSSVSASALKKQISLMSKALKVRIVAIEGDFSQDKIGKDFDVYKANALVYVVDISSFPRMLLAIDDKWGIVNVSALATDSPSKEVFEDRASKTLARATALVMGAATSCTKTSVLQPALTLEELDRINSTAIPSDSMMNIHFTMPKMGITQEKITTYIRACQEGWASLPTNDAQKAIWDKVHSIPKNPLRIKYDPSKAKTK